MPHSFLTGGIVVIISTRILIVQLPPLILVSLLPANKTKRGMIHGRKCSISLSLCAQAVFGVVLVAVFGVAHNSLQLCCPGPKKKFLKLCSVYPSENQVRAVHDNFQYGAGKHRLPY